MNVLDVAGNSLKAGAGRIEITVEQDEGLDLLRIVIADNGCGMNAEQVKRCLDPFYTTRTTRRVGLGIPLFKMAAESSDGSFGIESEEGAGTTVTATFRFSHIDRMPLGDMGETISQLMCMNEGVEIAYTFIRNGQVFEVSSSEFREVLDGAPMNAPEVMAFIREFISENMANL